MSACTQQSSSFPDAGILKFLAIMEQPVGLLHPCISPAEPREDQLQILFNQVILEAGIHRAPWDFITSTMQPTTFLFNISANHCKEHASLLLHSLLAESPGKLSTGHCTRGGVVFHSWASNRKAFCPESVRLGGKLQKLLIREMQVLQKLVFQEILKTCMFL